MIITIYYITCPIKSIPIYVGKTGNFHNRSLSHTSGNSNLAYYTRPLIRSGHKIEISVLEEIIIPERNNKNFNDWYSIMRYSEAMEVYWIQQFKTWGFNLINKNNFSNQYRNDYHYNF